VVQVKERVAGARDAVGHLAADARMPAPVRRGLDARPGGLEGGLGQAGVDVGLGRAVAGEIADLAVDAVLRDLVARAERVGVVGEGARGDAAVGAGAVAAEAVDGVEEDRRGEFACVALFGPVAGSGG
jgi:hypothetical protein